MADWQMMNRLHCTYSQLQEEPALEMAVFREFAAGEADAERSARRENEAKENVVVNR